MLKNKRILIIDDDQFSVLLTKLKLRKYTDENSISVIGQLHEAVDYFEDLKEKKPAVMPDLILLETMIDDARGWDLISHLEDISKHVSKSIKLVILTSSQFFSDYRRSTQYENVDGFLIKPLQMRLLNDIMSGAADSKSVHENMLLKSFIV